MPFIYFLQLAYLRETSSQLRELLINTNNIYSHTYNNKYIYSGLRSDIN